MGQEPKDKSSKICGAETSTTDEPCQRIVTGDWPCYQHRRAADKNLIEEAVRQHREIKTAGGGSELNYPIKSIIATRIYTRQTTGGAKHDTTARQGSKVTLLKDGELRIEGADLLMERTQVVYRYESRDDHDSEADYEIKESRKMPKVDNAARRPMGESAERGTDGLSKFKQWKKKHSRGLRIASGIVSAVAVAVVAEIVVSLLVFL